MENQYGDLGVFPKELKFLILTQLDAKSLGRVMQLNKAYSTLPSDLNVWKHFCLTQWNLPLDKLKKLDSIASNINWKREYRVMVYFSNRIFHNELAIRAEDREFVNAIDEDPNSLHYIAPQTTTESTCAVQAKFKLYPLPLVNFMVSYYEITVDHFNTEHPVIGIGLALPKYIRAMPGWGKDSYGLHADDGGFFNQRPFGITFCEPWTVGDTFGLGVNYATKQLFITRNGTLMGTLGKKLRNLMHLHPTIGINNIDNKCRLNFGQHPFEFNLDNYLKQLDADQEIAAKWPQKLYSQIIQEFEEMLIDDEDPDDVEAELLGAHDYYEHEQDDEEGEEPEPIDFSQAPNDNMSDEAQLKQMGVIIEELFSISEVLTNEETHEAVTQNRPEIKKLFNSLVADMQLPMNTEGPLEEIHIQLTESVYAILGSYYVEYLTKQKAVNKAKANKNTEAKLHTSEESHRYHDINLALLMTDQAFPNDHPLVVYCCNFLSRNFRMQMPDPEHPTPEDRAMIGLRQATALFYRNRTKQNEQEKEARKKKSEIVRQKKRKDFRDIFGEDAYYDKSAEQTLQAGPIRQTLSDEDKQDVNVAEHFCNTYMFGVMLAVPEDDEIQVWKYLSWWYFVAEEPLDPKATTEEYIKQCTAASKKGLKEWTEDLTRFKKVVHGSLLMLQDPDLDLEGHKFLILLRAWHILWSPLREEGQPTIPQVHALLVDRLTKLLRHEDLLAKYLDAFVTASRLDIEEESEEEHYGDEEEEEGNEKKRKGGSSWIVPAIATATAVAVLGAVFYFRNQLRKQ